MRRDLLLPAAAFTATVTTGLALIVRPESTLYLAGSVLEAGWNVLVLAAIVLAAIIAVGSLMPRKGWR